MNPNNRIPFLTHPKVTEAIRAALSVNGFGASELEDGIQDVYVKVLAAFQNGARVPSTLEAMKALCGTVAKHHAIDALRVSQTPKPDDELTGDPDRYPPLGQADEARDPVDARRQLEVLRDLFREGRMPEHGFAILEAVAAGCSFVQIAEELGTTERTVRVRLERMRCLYRGRMKKLGMWPGRESPGVFGSLLRTTVTLLFVA